MYGSKYSDCIITIHPVSVVRSCLYMTTVIALPGDTGQLMTYYLTKGYVQALFDLISLYEHVMQSLNLVCYDDQLIL